MPIVSQVVQVIKRIDNAQLMKLQDIVSAEVERRNTVKETYKELKSNG